MSFPPTHPALARALAARDYNTPTDVQTAVLADEAAGRDLLVSAQTGSGKTVAFGLAFAATVLGEDEKLGQQGEPLALVIAPTRELAMQVERELSWLYEDAGARIISCVGGMDPKVERRNLNFGCHIVVGTPGRLRDHLERGSLRMGSLRVAVLDEADEMLDLGFREDLEFILQAAPKERRTLLFSATLPKGIVMLAKTFQNDALRIAVAGGARGHADIEYRVHRIAPNDVEHAVVNVLRFHESPSSLVFCNTRDAVRHMHSMLLERGFSAVSLSGEFSQNERNHALQALRDGKARVCVATDVAARGIDLPGLDLVIHADVPNDAETLQHRSGRTGRAGRKGVSVILVPPARRRRVEQQLSILRTQPVWCNVPSAEQIGKLDDERMLQGLLQGPPPEAADIALGKKLLEQRSAEEIAGLLVRGHRARLPAPEDVVEQGNQGAPEKFGRDSGRDYGRDSGRDRGPRDSSPRAPRDMGPVVWFRMSVGREKQADPKWLIPEICKQGGITKREIGSIRIFDTETKFEVVEHAAAQFAESVAKTTSGIYITTTDAPSDGGARKFGPKKAYEKSGEKSGAKFERDGDKPFTPKPAPGPTSMSEGDAPTYEKKPYEKKAWDKKTGDKRPWDESGGGKKPWDKKARDDSAGYEKSRDSKDGDKKPYEKKPWDKKSGDKKFGDKKPWDKKPWDKKSSDKAFGDKRGGKFGGKKFDGKPGDRPEKKFKKPHRKGGKPGGKLGGKLVD